MKKNRSGNVHLVLGSITTTCVNVQKVHASCLQDFYYITWIDVVFEQDKVKVYKTTLSLVKVFYFFR